MISDTLLRAVHRRLIRLPDYHAIGLDELIPLQATGLAHDHIRVRERGVLLRVPKQSQLGLSATVNLTYQAACFERAVPGQHVPGLHAVLLPDETVPLGALLVDEVPGRPPLLPDDLPAIIGSLAAIHALPVPPASERAPLRDHADPVSETLREIAAQAAHLDAAD